MTQILCSSTFFLSLAIIFITFCLYYRKFICLLLKTLPRDGRLVIRVIKAHTTYLYAKIRNETLGRRFEAIARKNPNEICLYFEEETWTYQQVSHISNQLGNYFYEKGLRKGDTVGLFMENVPEYIFTCLGLSKIGVITSLVNCNLRMQSLDHFLQTTACKAVVFNLGLYQALSDLKSIGGLKDTPLYCWAKIGLEKVPTPAIHLDLELKCISKILPSKENQTGISDCVFYIGTSGTTGFPKAVIFRQSRIFMLTFGLYNMMKMKPADVVYVSLPLYHSTGFTVGVGNLFCYGCPLALRKKFSASKFWLDCCQYNATVAPYMAELCRYLLANPPSHYDTQHKVRLMIGAGLRQDIWQTFVDRFKIPMLYEMYGSSEGNCTLINIEGHVGAVGFYPRWVTPIQPVRLIKVNEDTMEPIRDPITGKCILCNIGQTGEMIGKIDRRLPSTNFEGYTDERSTDSKILRNAFKDGDSFYRSGDLLVQDIYGYFYFKDRQGDTFRWKSENVSTFEVESTIIRSVGFKDVAVYGVSIPGYDGKAGMAAIADTDASLNLKKLAADVMASLPHYARPLLLRVTNELEMTGSFKMIKNKLKNEGLKYPHPKDFIFIFQNNEYVALTEGLHQSLINGKLRI